MTFDPNLTRIELRQAILRYLTLKGWKRKDLARVSGIEPVTISNTLNNKQCFMLYQLDAITQAFDLPVGFFYNYFKAECCNHEGRIRPNKCGEFIRKCLELEQEDIIEDFLHLLSEDRDVSRQAAILLDIAEHIYASPLRAKALPYYEKIRKLENRISERYAICYYRRFLILREQGFTPQLVEALHQFTPLLHRLPTNLQREAYRDVLMYYNLVEAWSMLLGYAEEMEVVVRETSQTNDADNALHLAQALHYQAIALRGLGKLDEALAKTDEYASLHPDYAQIAETNRTLLAIQMGDTDRIPSDVDNQSSKEETYELLTTSLEAYLMKGMVEKADDCLTQYEAEVTELCQLSPNNPLIRYAIHLRSLRAAYFDQVGEKAKALEEVHLMLDLAEQTGNMDMLKHHTARFWNIQSKENDSL